MAKMPMEYDGGQLVTETVILPSITVNANSSGDTSMDISKAGYTPILGTISTTMNPDVVLVAANVAGNTGGVTVRNLSSASKTVAPRMQILYQKND